MTKAYPSGAYSMAEIAGFFGGMHCMTVSRAVQKFEDD